ncbi:MAG: heme-dependent peroxidase, partial [Staphylococcus epidermidis]|nr:heme-dependent peroxidase [Staphylococcus epidermidis]
MNPIRILKKERLIMSEAAETLDGWYSLHLFYAVDWTTFRLIAEDDREAMITE